LSSRGWEVTPTAMVADAQAALRERSFKLILTDVFLPDGNGFEILQTVRSGNGLKLRAGDHTPPVIVMTADAALDHAVNAVRHGASDFLVKPFSMEALDAALSRVQLVEKLSLVPA